MQIKIFPFWLSSFPQNRHFITRPLGCWYGNSSTLYWIVIGYAIHSVYTKISDHCPKRWGILEQMHNMAKSVQLFWAITAIFAGLFLERGLSQRQICSYYGMNLLSSCYDCYLAEVILLYSLKTRCVLNRFELKTYTAKLNIRLMRFLTFCCRC